MRKAIYVDKRINFRSLFLTYYRAVCYSNETLFKIAARSI